jgi:hypothetical protein
VQIIMEDSGLGYIKDYVKFISITSLDLCKQAQNQKSLLKYTITVLD